MSKRKENKPALADWQVILSRSDIGAAMMQDFPQSWWVHKRGRYTFSDEQGVVAEFAAGAVLEVRRTSISLGFGGGGEYAPGDERPAEPVTVKAGKQ